MEGVPELPVAGRAVRAARAAHEGRRPQLEVSDEHVGVDVVVVRVEVRRRRGERDEAGVRADGGLVGLAVAGQPEVAARAAATLTSTGAAAAGAAMASVVMSDAATVLARIGSCHTN